MARIRSIKPEFFTDSKIKRLRTDSALAFIGLWTVADDFGYFPSDTLELSLKLPLWKPQQMQAIVSALARAGLVKVSREAGVGLIVGWDHQRIKDRRASKWNGVEIQWDAPEIDAPRSQKNGLGKDRIGKDRIGKDNPIGHVRERGGASPAVQADLELAGEVQKSKPVQPKQAFIAAYVKAYRGRFGKGARPHLGGKVAGQVGRYLDEVPLERACALVETYLGMSDSWFITKAFDFGTFLENQNKIALALDTGRRITQAEARQAEDGDYYAEQMNRMVLGGEK